MAARFGSCTEARAAKRPVQSSITRAITLSGAEPKHACHPGTAPTLDQQRHEQVKGYARDKPS